MNGFAAREGETKAQVFYRAYRRLENTKWSKGCSLPNKAVPGARPRAVAAGAKKLMDIAWAHARRTNSSRSCIAA